MLTAFKKNAFIRNLIIAGGLLLFALFVLPQFIMPETTQASQMDMDMNMESSADAEMDMTSEMDAEMDMAMDMSSGHSHITIEIDPEQAPPAIEFTLTPHENGNYDLNLQLENFSLVAPGEEPESVFGEGHAHLYINGESIFPIFTETTELSIVLFESGENLVVVSLNDSTHAAWTNEGALIMDGLVLDTLTNETTEVFELVYTLDWNTNDVNFNADESVTINNDLGYTITLEEGYVVDFSAELVHCTTAGWLDWLYPSIAFAGHGGGDPDQSKTTSAWIESLTDPQTIVFDQLFLKNDAYCQIHYLIGPGANSAANIADGYPISEESLVLSGTYTAPESETAIAFTLESDLGWGSLYDLPVANFTLAQDSEMLITRDLASLFDGIDFETQSVDEQAQTVLRNLVNGTMISID